MTNVAPEPSLPTPIASAPVLPVTLRHTLDISAVWALFRMTVSRQCRARRLAVLGLLFALPVLFAVLARYYGAPYVPRDAEFALIFSLIPHALVPLAALLYASGMIQDEVEEQTLTYLLIRPLPRWAIYLSKLLATVIVTSLLAGFFTTATYVAIFWGDATGLWNDIIVARALPTCGLIALALLAYCSLFGCLSLFVRRSLALGVAYIILFEGVVANIDFVVRRLTVMWYFRVLCVRQLDLSPTEWSIDLSAAPSTRDCVLTLVAASLVATAIAVLAFTTREFRVKTPEGS